MTGAQAAPLLAKAVRVAPLVLPGPPPSVRVLVQVEAPVHVASWTPNDVEPAAVVRPPLNVVVIAASPATLPVPWNPYPAVVAPLVLTLPPLNVVPAQPMQRTP
jgi:hypothetical protein